MTEKILAVINLLEYDTRPNQLYEKLQSLQRDCFEPDEKIVVLYNEQDYFYHDHPTGFTMHNFMNMITSLDINLGSLVIITTYDDLDRSLKPWLVDKNNWPEIRVTMNAELPWASLLYPKETMNAIGINRDIQHHALCTLGKSRLHKNLLLAFVITRGLLGKVQVSYGHGSGPITEPEQKLAFDHHCNVGMNHSFPPRGSGSEGLLPFREPMLASLSSMTVPTQVSSDLIPAASALAQQFPSHDFYRFFAFCIVCTSQIHNHHRYPICDKIFKPLLTETPFVVIGTYGLLQRLRDNGFETFGNWWDESYDDIRDPQQRLVRCMELIESLCNWPLDHLRQIYSDMRPLLERNRLRARECVDINGPRMYNRYWSPQQTQMPC